MAWEEKQGDPQQVEKDHHGSVSSSEPTWISGKHMLYKYTVFCVPASQLKSQPLRGRVYVRLTLAVSVGARQQVS